MRSKDLLKPWKVYQCGCKFFNLQTYIRRKKHRYITEQELSKALKITKRKASFLVLSAPLLLVQHLLMMLTSGSVLHLPKDSAGAIIANGTGLLGNKYMSSIRLQKSFYFGTQLKDARPKASSTLIADIQMDKFLLTLMALRLILVSTCLSYLLLLICHFSGFGSSAHYYFWRCNLLCSAVER